MGISKPQSSDWTSQSDRKILPWHTSGHSYKVDINPSRGTQEKEALLEDSPVAGNSLILMIYSGDVRSI
ncbi:hypothetical protein CHS0354_006435 [Potamilus streckersoni]|uniref:Uncharacterized protein n=1 Tax=Potamilus streckersoni TaxID=2493646 RepID=A0AAE0T983_9BIVA|nr:hypothetical protein CHS0354_006435 [Potamilus streckersoni]